MSILNKKVALALKRAKEQQKAKEQSISSQICKKEEHQEGYSFKPQVCKKEEEETAEEESYFSVSLSSNSSEKQSSVRPYKGIYPPRFGKRGSTPTRNIVKNYSRALTSFAASHYADPYLDSIT